MTSSGEIIVGLSIAASGALSRQGREALDGARLWESYINQSGGIAVAPDARRPVRLIWLDDESRLDRARLNVSRLLADERVDLLLGPYGSAATLAAAELADRRGRILWNYGGASDDIFSRGFRRLVGIFSPASDYLRALPAWLARTHPSLRRILVAHLARGSFGAHIARGIWEAAAAVGAFVVEAVPYGPGAVLQVLDTRPV
ncbi:MAG: ABC transporter substrate-binding protein [Acidobacteria bacterium]|nr:ABC transporter substrate-binding protein [Acidobacteriota bacterium]